MKPKDKKLILGWTVQTSNYKSANVASAFPNEAAWLATFSS